MPGTDASPTIADLLAAGERPTMSFEFFPPKDDAGQEQLTRAVRELEPLRPDFVSVTYGASGSTRSRTLDAARTITAQAGFRTMGHLTCVSQSRAEVEGAIASYADAGIRHILAVRGDPPGGPTAPWRAHPQGLANATELVRLVRQAGDFCIGVAAFPDAHADRKDFELDARILLEKEAAGASFAITQLFFSTDSYFRLVERVRALGCRLPILAGIQPVTNLAQIERFATFSGAPLPEPLVSSLHAVAGDPAAVRSVGLGFATRFCDRLLAGGAPGLHFFTLNRSTATAEILANLRRISPH